MTGWQWWPHHTCNHCYEQLVDCKDNRIKGWQEQNDRGGKQNDRRGKQNDGGKGNKMIGWGRETMEGNGDEMTEEETTRMAGQQQLWWWHRVPPPPQQHPYPLPQATAYVVETGSNREGDRMATRWSPQPDEKDTDGINRYHDMGEECHHPLPPLSCSQWDNFFSIVLYR